LFNNSFGRLADDDADELQHQEHTVYSKPLPQGQSLDFPMAPALPKPKPALGTTVRCFSRGLFNCLAGLLLFELLKEAV
jgi:hypothetical protein